MRRRQHSFVRCGNDALMSGRCCGLLTTTRTTHKTPQPQDPTKSPPERCDGSSGGDFGGLFLISYLIRKRISTISPYQNYTPKASKSQYHIVYAFLFEEIYANIRHNRTANNGFSFLNFYVIYANLRKTRIFLISYFIMFCVLSLSLFLAV